MFYFIPSWYNSKKDWFLNTLPWYLVPQKIEFDDTINQVRMFSDANEDVQLILLNYMPHLRYFLYRQELLHVPYWSVFDDIQSITIQEQLSVFDYKQLPWPEHVEFVYTPFLIVVRQDNQTLARIEYGYDGNIIWIDFFNNAQIEKRYIVDDRGFISCIVYMKNNVEEYREYLNMYGQWQIREYVETGYVEVNEAYAHLFKKAAYESMFDLLSEKIHDYLHNRQETIVLASDIQHNELILKQVSSQFIVLSFFENRYDLNSEQLLLDANRSDMIVVSTENQKHQIKEKIQNEHIYVLPPFDARLSLGESQREHLSYIYLRADDVSSDIFEQVIIRIGQIMREEKEVVLIIGTYYAHLEQVLLEKTKKIIEEYIEPTFFDVEEQDTFIGIDVKKEDRVSVHVSKREDDLIKLLKKVRLVIDLSDNPDVFTQIASISAGIPTINLYRSMYIEHEKNGFILNTIEDLSEAIHHYLDGLRRWNEALVYTVQRISNYTSGKIVSDWKLLIRRKNG
ncbi:accessory Sec system protein Asp1 [Carnobacteriaceae bacterium zg-84]|uniref:accessory Sec system protein Asp1 n=1 Tax=Granulicatella sp. zg-84 TaxID=2678503 RepID=UPI0013C062E1|nr:accessory Sec system protein Asp1 [Granulicatella sp. zg-84]NEW66014.1 accessory Sec system protein Asp1 [Granulicatella sp. zg-84]QMI85842.1 accessory Sec system protein Asp1 [Carnobacteriaceae bacterium zg-84]